MDAFKWKPKAAWKQLMQALCWEFLAFAFPNQPFDFRLFFFFLMYKINGSYRLLFTVIRQNSAWHSGLSLAKLARMLPSSCDLPNTMGMHPALLGSAPHSDLGSPQITASQIKHTVIIRCSWGQVVLHFNTAFLFFLSTQVGGTSLKRLGLEAEGSTAEGGMCGHQPAFLGPLAGARPGPHGTVPQQPFTCWCWGPKLMQVPG